MRGESKRGSAGALGSQDKNYWAFTAKLLLNASLALTFGYAAPAMGGLTQSGSYDLEILVAPGADPVLNDAQAFGINEVGQVVLNSDTPDGRRAYIYDSRSGEYTEIGDTQDFFANGIGNNGRMAGNSAEEDCLWRDKDGIVNKILVPYPVDTCSGRAMNDQGQITGFTIEADGTWKGFIYDIQSEVFESFLPSVQTFAQGVSQNGTVVGSVRVREDGRNVTSGYIRSPQGDVQEFSITNALPGQTRARGISSDGKQITGFYYDTVNPGGVAYVMDRSDINEAGEATLREDQILTVDSCIEPQTEIFGMPVIYVGSELFVQDINNQSVVAGQCSDCYIDAETFGFLGCLNFAIVGRPVAD